MGDIDWKGILEKAIDIGGPILGTVINIPAPGAGTVVAAGLPLVKKYVVEPYVAGTGDKADAAPAGLALQGATSSSAEQQTAMAVLQRKGWSPDEVQQHVQGPAAPSRPDFHPEHGARLVHGVLQEAGWHAEARAALLRGPYAFADYMKPTQHVPSEEEIARFTGHDVDGILQANLHHATERGGHTPELYHGTHEAHVAGLGVTTEHAGTKES